MIKMDHGNVPNMKEQKYIVLGVKIAALIIALLILIFNSIYTVNEQQQGVITTLGKATSEVEPGLNFKIPFIQQVHKIDTTIRGFAIGYDQESEETNAYESMMITNDFNFVNVDFYVEYKVSNATDYLYNSQNPVDILKNIAQSCIRTVVGSYKVDSVLTDGKSEIQSSIKEMIMDKLEKQNLGIQLINITIQDAEPPTQDVMQAFKAVETAKQQKETIINNAQKYRNEKLPAAKADVDNILQEANTKKTQRVNQAQGQVALFDATYKEYVKNPEITKKRMFYEAMEDLLPSLEIIIDSGNGSVQKILPLDSFVDNQSNTNINNSTSNSSSTTSKSSTNKDDNVTVSESSNNSKANESTTDKNNKKN